MNNNFKIKNILAVVISLFMLVCAVGCADDSGLTALRIGGSYDDAENGDFKSEYELWSTANIVSHNDINAAKTATVVFEGKTYSGEYKNSRVMLQTDYSSHSYSFEGGTFEINGKTRELSFIHIYSPGIAEKKLSAEECNKIAQTIASKYINIDEYVLKINQNSSFYEYAYIKEFFGVQTGEKLVIGLNFDGSTRLFRLQMCGRFPEKSDAAKYKQRIDFLSSSEAEKLIDKKIAEIYPQQKDVKITHSIENKSLVLVDDNKLGMLYNVEVEKSYIVDKEEHTEGALELLLIK